MSRSSPSTKPIPINAGHSYLAKVGGWIFEVEAIELGVVYYTVIQTGQLCKVRIEAFAQRVARVMSDYEEAR